MSPRNDGNVIKLRGRSPGHPCPERPAALDAKEPLVKSPAPRRLTRWGSKALVFLEEVVPALLLALIVVALTADVVGRYIFSNPLQGAAEVSLIAFVWATYLAVAGVARQGRHIAIDLVTG